MQSLGQECLTFAADRLTYGGPLFRPKIGKMLEPPKKQRKTECPLEIGQKQGYKLMILQLEIWKG